MLSYLKESEVQPMSPSVREGLDQSDATYGNAAALEDLLRTANNRYTETFEERATSVRRLCEDAGLDTEPTWSESLAIGVGGTALASAAEAILAATLPEAALVAAVVSGVVWAVEAAGESAASKELGKHYRGPVDPEDARITFFRGQEDALTEASRASRDEFNNTQAAEIRSEVAALKRKKGTDPEDALLPAYELIDALTEGRDVAADEQFQASLKAWCELLAATGRSEWFENMSKRGLPVMDDGGSPDQRGDGSIHLTVSNEGGQLHISQASVGGVPQGLLDEMSEWTLGDLLLNQSVVVEGTVKHPFRGTARLSFGWEASGHIWNLCDENGVDFLHLLDGLTPGTEIDELFEKQGFIDRGVTAFRLMLEGESRSLSAQGVHIKERP